MPTLRKTRSTTKGKIQVIKTSTLENVKSEFFVILLRRVTFFIFSIYKFNKIQFRCELIIERTWPLGN